MLMSRQRPKNNVFVETRCPSGHPFLTPLLSNWGGGVLVPEAQATKLATLPKPGVALPNYTESEACRGNHKTL